MTIAADKSPVYRYGEYVYSHRELNSNNDPMPMFNGDRR